MYAGKGKRGVGVQGARPCIFCAMNAFAIPHIRRRSTGYSRVSSQIDAHLAAQGGVPSSHGLLRSLPYHLARSREIPYDFGKSPAEFGAIFSFPCASGHFRAPFRHLPRNFRKTSAQLRRCFCATFAQLLYDFRETFAQLPRNLRTTPAQPSRNFRALSAQFPRDLDVLSAGHPQARRALFARIPTTLSGNSSPLHSSKTHPSGTSRRHFPTTRPPATPSDNTS